MESVIEPVEIELLNRNSTPPAAEVMLARFAEHCVESLTREREAAAAAAAAVEEELAAEAPAVADFEDLAAEAMESGLLDAAPPLEDLAAMAPDAPAVGPEDSVDDFFASDDLNIDLPGLDDGAPAEAGDAWLDGGAAEPAAADGGFDDMFGEGAEVPAADPLGDLFADEPGPGPEGSADAFWGDDAATVGEAAPDEEPAAAAIWGDGPAGSESEDVAAAEIWGDDSSSEEAAAAALWGDDAVDTQSEEAAAAAMWGDSDVPAAPAEEPAAAPDDDEDWLGFGSDDDAAAGEAADDPLADLFAGAGDGETVELPPKALEDQ